MQIYMVCKLVDNCGPGLQQNTMGWYRCYNECWGRGLGLNGEGILRIKQFVAYRSCGIIKLSLHLGMASFLEHKFRSKVHATVSLSYAARLASGPAVKKMQAVVAFRSVYMSANMLSRTVRKQCWTRHCYS